MYCRARSYVVQLSYGGRKIRITLGEVGVCPFEGPPDHPGARDMAIAARAAARRGLDPREAIGSRRRAEGLTVAGIWKQYETAGFPKSNSTQKKRPATIRADKSRYRKHFAKQIGLVPISALDSAS